MTHDDPVGYGCPPKHTRFQPGKSGNAKGRPKGRRNLKTELELELHQRILVREGDRQTRVTKRHAVLKAQLAKAIKGDTRAAAWVFELVGRLLDPDGTGSAGSARQLSPDDRAILADYAARLAAPEPAGGQNRSGSPDDPDDDASE